MDIHLEPPPGAAVLDQARLLDQLTAASLREAVAQTEDVARRLLARTVQLQQLAERLEPGPVAASLRALVEDQASDLLQAGQYHDIFSQAVERSISIQSRRAALVEQLFASVRHDSVQPPLLRTAAELLAACRGEQARHAVARGSGAGTVELF